MDIRPRGASTAPLEPARRDSRETACSRGQHGFRPHLTPAPGVPRIDRPDPDDRARLEASRSCLKRIDLPHDPPLR